MRQYLRNSLIVKGTFDASHFLPMKIMAGHVLASLPGCTRGGEGLARRASILAACARLG